MLEPLHPEATTLPAEQLPVIEIRSQRRWLHLDLAELWRHRELMYLLAWRDFRVKYRQTVLGAAWAVIQPFVTMVVFTFFFGKLARIDSEGVPYALFSFAGLVPWRLFQAVANHATGSVLRSKPLVQKVYCPRLILPIAASFPALVDLFFSCAMLLAIVLYFGHPLRLTLLLLPVVIVIAHVSALGLGLILAAVNVRYRDAQYVAGFGLQLLLFLSPIIYPAESVYRALSNANLPTWLYGLNPVTGIVEGFRWCALGGDRPVSVILASASVGVALLIGGVLYYKLREDTFADYL